jgi:hypothetical protein
MTVLEQRFMEQVPRLLGDIANEMAALRKEIADLKEELKAAKSE